MSLVYSSNHGFNLLFAKGSIIKILTVKDLDFTKIQYTEVKLNDGCKIASNLMNVEGSDLVDFVATSKAGAIVHFIELDIAQKRIFRNI